ncbi:hypothetical protein, partial [Streptomyces shenzhenensis]|uniref:hypothetical protein n=1 Tax=Streptomyces shenzhenensis TaxID=943815 RepID=UPI001C68EB11
QGRSALDGRRRNGRLERWATRRTPEAAVTGRRPDEGAGSPGDRATAAIVDVVQVKNLLTTV